MKFSWETLLLIPQPPISLILEKGGIGHVPIKCLKTWSWSTFFFRNLFFIAILRWHFFLLKFWHFYQLLSLDEFSYSPISIKTMTFAWVRIKICLKKKKLQNNFMNSYLVIIKIIYIQKPKIQAKEVIQLQNFKFPSETLLHHPKIIVFIEIGEYENSSRLRSW